MFVYPSLLRLCLLFLICTHLYMALVYLFVDDDDDDDDNDDDAASTKE
jgi:hypothetical protein